MPEIKLKLEGDGAWPDLLEKMLQDDVYKFESLDVAVLDGGMESGLPSVAFRFDLPDGKIVFAQTSLRALKLVVDAIVAKYGDPGL